MHPTFPSLSVREVISDVAMFPNSREPIPFRTAAFEGHALFMLVSDPPDPFFAKHFNGRKRQMELHFQGKFLKKPQGTLYIGGEIEEKMNIGVVLRTMAGMMLRLVKSLSYGKFHHSFGSTRMKEKPHIVTSFYNGVDAFVVTPPGEVPPPLGRDLPEAKEDRARRRKALVGTLSIDTEATYSFSFHSMYIDFPNWQVVKIPGFQPVDLHSYWGALPLSVALYDLSDDTGDYHSGDNKRYFWKYRFSHTPLEETEIGGSGGPSVVFPPHLLAESGDSTTAHAGAAFAVPAGIDVQYDSDDSDNHSTLIRRRSNSSPGGGGGGGSSNGGGGDRGGGRGGGNHRISSTHTTGLVVDVPAFLECAAEDSCEKVAVFIVRIFKPGTAEEAEDSPLRGGSCLVCNANDLSDLASFASGDSGVQMSKLCRKIKSIRFKNRNLPLLEAKRRALDSLLVDMSSDASQTKLLNVLVGGWGRSLSHLLNPNLAPRRYKVMSTRQAKRDAMSFHSSPMMLAEWESFWREGWGVLAKVPLSSPESLGEQTAPVLSFYRVHSARPMLSLQAADILAVTLLSHSEDVGGGGEKQATGEEAANDSDVTSLGGEGVVGIDLPLPRRLRFGFDVHTYGRVFTFAVASATEADEWVAILGSMIGARQSASSSSSGSNGGGGFVNPGESGNRPHSNSEVAATAAVAAVSAAAAAAEQSSPNWIRVGENRMAESLIYTSAGERGRAGGGGGSSGSGAGGDGGGVIQINLDPRTLFLGNSSHWASPARTVLNARRLSFASDIRSRRRQRRRSAASPPGVCGNVATYDAVSSPARFACHLSSSILRMALQLRPDSSVSTWSAFMDRVVLLKDVDLSATRSNSNERTMFWINVYHTLVIHTRLLLGAPNSAYGFFKQAKHVSYEIFAVPYRDVYSLLEIEHCVLRGASSKPRVSIAGFFLPSRAGELGKDDVKWDMAPSVADSRINFILNYATVSSLRRIPVFSADGHDDVAPPPPPRASIDAQFDLASAIYLQHFAVVDVESRSVVLPKVLDWYRGDFGKTQPSHRGVLLEVHRLLKGGIKGSKLSILLQGENAPWEAAAAPPPAAAGGERADSSPLQQRQLMFSVRYERFSWHPQPLGSLTKLDVSML